LNSLNCKKESRARSRSLVSFGGANRGANVPKTSYSNINASNQFASDESKLSYYVIIDIELYPGKEGIPVSQRAVLSCQTRYEKIRQSYANLFGIQYKPHDFNSAIYNPSKKSGEKERESKTRNNRRRRIDRRYTRRLPLY
jgi:hypothetical protein